MLFTNSRQVKNALAGIIEVQGNDLRVADPDDLREKLIDRLVYNAIFHPSDPLRQLLHWLIREAAARLEIYPTSMERLYAAMGTGTVTGFTVPAVSLHVLTYDLARSCLRAAADTEAGAYAFELQAGDEGAPLLDPLEYSSCVLAAAIRERHQGSVFLQADCLRIDPKRYAANRDEEMDRLKALIEDTLAAGFLNLDLDTMGLVDPSRPSLPEQQAASFNACAELAAFIRETEPAEVYSSLGAAIAESQRRTETANELRAFAGGFLPEFRNRNTVEPGLSKIVLQARGQGPAARSESGVEPPVSVNIDVLRDLAEIAHREYNLCIGVKAPYLPDDLLGQFPVSGVGEVKINADIEGWVYDHEAFPQALRDEIRGWMDGQLRLERRLGETDEAFYRRGLRQALGPFKQRLWDLPQETRERIASDLRERIGACMDALNVRATAGLVRDTVDIEKLSLPAPVSGDYHDVETTLRDILEQGAAPAILGGA